MNRISKAQGVWCSTLFVVTFCVTSSLFAPAPRPVRAQMQQIPCTAGAPFFTFRSNLVSASASAEVACAGGNIPCVVQYGCDVYQWSPWLDEWVHYLPGGGMTQVIHCGEKNSYGWGVNFVQLDPQELYKLEMVVKKWDAASQSYVLAGFGKTEFFVP